MGVWETCRLCSCLQGVGRSVPARTCPCPELTASVVRVSSPRLPGEAPTPERQHAARTCIPRHRDSAIAAGCEVVCGPSTGVRRPALLGPIRGLRVLPSRRSQPPTRSVEGEKCSHLQEIRRRKSSTDKPSRRSAPTPAHRLAPGALHQAKPRTIPKGHSGTRRNARQAYRPGASGSKRRLRMSLSPRPG